MIDPLSNKLQKPTIGRIVHYYDESGRIYPAIITEVWSDICVNLNVFADTRGVVSKTSVIYTNDFGGPAFHWSWPSIQK